MKNSFKKLSLAALACVGLASALNAQQDAYTDVVKPVYESSSSSKIIGKLLPTNKFKILSIEGDKIKAEIIGYENPAAKGVIYAANNARVIALAFAKTAKPEISLIKKGANGEWDLVKASFYTTASDTHDKLAPMMQRADKLYSENCGICHALPVKSHFSANQWPAIFKSMLSRTAIDKKDEWLVIEYLQKNSKDVKISN